MYEPIGVLKITVWIRTAPLGEAAERIHARRVTLFREYCRREEAEDRIKAFRDLNPSVDDRLEAVWQTEPERIRLD